MVVTSSVENWNSSTGLPLDGVSACINKNTNWGGCFHWLIQTTALHVNTFQYVCKIKTSPTPSRTKLSVVFVLVCCYLLSLLSVNGKDAPPKVPLDMEIKTYCFWWLQEALSLHRWHFLCVCIIALAFRRKAIPISLAHTWTEIRWITDYNQCSGQWRHHWWQKTGWARLIGKRKRTVAVGKMAERFCCCICLFFFNQHLPPTSIISTAANKCAGL